MLVSTRFKRVSIGSVKILSFRILKNIGYNLFGFTSVIIIWGSLFAVLRVPWKILIKKKYGLVYCSIYLLLLVILMEEYCYFSLIKELEIIR